jgi:hypothetical protein
MSLPSESDKELIIPELYFLIIDNKKGRKFVTLEMGKVKLNKKNINLEFFKNKKLNTYWDITDDNNYVQITEKEFKNEENYENEELEYTNEKITGASNKEIYQSSQAQKLSQEEIEKLKNTTQDKNELIKKIIENNTSMEKRTIFSQEKILKKKALKYKFLIYITPPSLFNIIETFFIYECKSINQLRFDSVASMLINSNFQEKSSTIIIDESNFILTLAYAQRTQFGSKVMHIFFDRIPSKNINLLNLNRAQKANIEYMRYSLLMDDTRMFKNFYKNKFANLVLCLKEDKLLVQYFFELWQFLRPSGNFVLFSKDKEILISIDKIVIENNLGIDSKIIETISREYQILELRTHPMMNNKGYSGYVYVGYKAAEQ